MRSVGMLDLQTEYELFRDDIRAAVESVLESQRFIGGPAIAELEENLRERVGVSSAIAVSSGTDALLCAMMALEIGAGDEVILPAFTFFATAGTVARLGAKPVFVDIDERTFNLDAGEVERAVTNKTKAIIAVHLFGQCADMDAINAIAQRHGFSVIEDMAQAIDATVGGQRAGTLGRVACCSFYPTKNLGGFGEGGMILTDDPSLADVARSLRNHGESQRYVHDRVGGNFRLDTMKAAILLVKLAKLEEFTKRRRESAAIYNRLLENTGVVTPHVPAGHQPVYHQYSVLCEGRDELMAHLKADGVGSGVYYPIGLHLQPCFAALGYKAGSLPVTEHICSRILSLPCHPMLCDSDVEYAAACVRSFYGNSCGATSVRGVAAKATGA